MRILFLSQLLPYPLDSGAKTRAFHTLEWLAQKHSITLLSYRREEDSTEAVDVLRQICSKVVSVPIHRSKIHDFWSLLRSFASSLPALIVRDRQKKMTEMVTSLQAETPFDAVHSDQIWMAPHALEFSRLNPGVMSVLDQHNASFLVLARLASSETNPLKRCILKRESRRMFEFERSLINRFDRITWVSQADMQSFSGELDNPEKRIVIPIGVETSPPVARQSHPFRVTFLGGFNWPSNLEGVEWFISRIWERVSEANAELKLTLVGRKPPSGLIRRAVQSRSIEVKGFVKDIDPLLRETAVFIVPLLSGSGIRVKILDAWRWGLPVVSTTVGAEGLEYRDGEDLLIADTPDQFCRAVSTLSCEKTLAQRLIQNGKKRVMEDYAWKNLYHLWDEVYNQE